MRATTAFKRLLRLDDVNVVDVEFLPTIVIVTVALRRRRLVCPHCGFKTRSRYDTRPAPSCVAPPRPGHLARSRSGPACAVFVAPTTAWWSRPSPSPGRGRT